MSSIQDSPILSSYFSDCFSRIYGRKKAEVENNTSQPTQNQFERTTSEKVKRVVGIVLLTMVMFATVSTALLSCAGLTILSAEAAAIGLSPALCVGAIVISLIAFAVLCKTLDHFVSVDKTFLPIISRYPEGAALIAAAREAAKIQKNFGEFIIRIESKETPYQSERVGNVIRINNNLTRVQQLCRLVIELNNFIQETHDFPGEVKKLTNNVYATDEEYARANAKIKYESFKNKEAMLAILLGLKESNVVDFEEFYATKITDRDKQLHRKSWNDYQKAPQSTRFIARVLANILY